MVCAAIGGMQLKRWTGYFRIILPTMRVLRDAKRNPGCLAADTFKSGDVFFAVSVWTDAEQMQAFGRSGEHGRLTRIAMQHMALFYNHSQEVPAPPDRPEAVALWKAAMAARGEQGTVGHYVPKGSAG